MSGRLKLRRSCCGSVSFTRPRKEGRRDERGGRIPEEGRGGEGRRGEGRGLGERIMGGRGYQLANRIPQLIRAGMK